jgi:hypothetical protein
MRRMSFQRSNSYWFQLMGKVLKGSDIVQENVYNMEAPVTPVTPVCAASFAALRDAVINGDACALDEEKKRELDRHIGKLAKAAQISYAKNTLQEDRIRGLLEINDEAKPRVLDAPRDPSS